MSTHQTRSRRRVFLVATSVVLVVLALFLTAPSFLTALEAKFYDLHFALRGTRNPGDRVAIVAIDEKSLEALGRWPWPRSVLASLLTKVSQAGARVIAVDILLSEPEVSGELRAATRLSERFGALGLLDTPAAGRALRAELDTLARQADHDGQLEAALRASGRTVLPVAFDIDPGMADRAPEPSGPALKSALTSFRHYSDRGLYPPPSARTATFPVPKLAAAARDLGHVTMVADLDGSTRWEALVFEYRGHYYPSLAVQAVSLALGLAPIDLKLDFGRGLEVGSTMVPVDARNRMLIDYAGPGGTFPHFSAVDVLRGAIPAAALRDRIVFIGATAKGTYDLRVTPTSPVFPGVEKHATVAGDLLGGRFLRRPDWVELVELVGILFWPMFLGWLLPRLRPAMSVGAAIVSAGVFLGAAHLAFLQGLWIPVVYPSLALILSPLAITGYLYFTEERERRWIKQAFRQYVPPSLVEQLGRDRTALAFGGQRRTLTVLFSDIRGFTTFSERHAPEEVVATLQEYLSELVDVIFRHRGTLDKFIGDAIMAFFGAPFDNPEHALQACRAALEMSEAVDRLNARWRAEGREPLETGFGIATGEMLVGNLGSTQRFTYTVIGDQVNLAARLETLNKEYPTRRHIIISESTYEAAKDALSVRRLGEVRVKGKMQSVVAYELEGLRGSPSVETPVAAGQPVDGFERAGSGHAGGDGLPEPTPATVEGRT